jgi:recombination protein RecA
MSPEFGDIFKGVEKDLAKDTNSVFHKPDDIYVASVVPYGILTGIPQLDYSIGRPGVPVGKVIEFFGFEKTGKTTAALHILANAQRMGGGGVFIDTEFSWDENRFIEIGGDPAKNFRPSEADTMEAIFRQIDSILTHILDTEFNKPFVIVVDSITAAETEYNKAREFGEEARVGQDARTIRSGMRKIMSKVARSNVCLIFINHAISTIAKSPFAKQSMSAGGHAIKLFATLRCGFTDGTNLWKTKDGEKIRIGQETYITIEKLKQSKLEHPKIKTQLLNDVGFDTRGDLLEAGTRTGWIIPKNQKVFTLNEREFDKKSWGDVVDELGGTTKAYTTWIKWCIDSGKIRSWS